MQTSFFVRRVYIFPERTLQIMGVDVFYEDENGKELGRVLDKKNSMKKIICEIEESDSHCLRYIDLYGDTVFNQLQMDPLKKEFEIVLNKTQEKEIKYFIKKILVLIDKSKGNAHTYIKFIGD